jgi:hypothetical protein
MEEVKSNEEEEEASTLDTDDKYVEKVSSNDKYGEKVSSNDKYGCQDMDSLARRNYILHQFFFLGEGKQQ